MGGGVLDWWVFVFNRIVSTNGIASMSLDRKLESWVEVVLCVLEILIIWYRLLWRTFRWLGGSFCLRIIVLIV